MALPTPYQLMEAYRTWWRSQYQTTPNSQAVVIAAAWARYVLSTHEAGLEQPTAEQTK